METSNEVAVLEREARAFEQWYSNLQESVRVHGSQDASYAGLVAAQGNEDLPVHRWFNLKEAFSASLPPWMVGWMKQQYGHTSTVILDPFIGCGTTGVALATGDVSVTGVERSPFIEFAARTKTLITVADAACLADAIGRLRPLLDCTSRFRLPALSTFRHESYFRRRDVQTLVAAVHHIRRRIRCACTRDLLLLGVAAAIDDVANLYKDGRALRYELKAERPSAVEAIARRWERILSDVRDGESRRDIGARPLYTVFQGTAVDLRSLKDAEGSPRTIADASFDSIIYSPPYLNNFDYSEVYKLELWLLGFLLDVEQWRALRRSTIRSHPSVKTPPTSYLQDDPRVASVHRHLQDMVNSRCLAQATAASRRRMILGYFDDMYLALREQWRVLVPGGLVAFVVANSRHYYLPIATDLILIEIARCLGFQSLDIVVLRKRNGRTRQKSFLRESAVFLRKPHF